MKEETKRFEGLGTKIDPAMYEVLNACCDALGVDVYHLLQWFAYTIIRAAAPLHKLDPRIQKLLTMLESDAGWQQAFNIANPNGLKVAQVILILEQECHKGFGAVMIDKPFMSEARQTECVDIITERILSVCMYGVYKRLRDISSEKTEGFFIDVILDIIENEKNRIHDKEFIAELPGMGEHADNGRQVAYGKKTKAKQKRTPDSLALDQRIKFDDYDREVAESEANGWDGEIRQREESPDELMRPFDVEW